MFGIQAGASSRTQVTRPGAASNSLAPNWCIAWSKADGVRMPGASAMGARLVCRNTGECPWLVSSMENMKHFDGPTFEADVLPASNPVVVDFYADLCGPCRMMSPVVEQLADEYAGKVTIGKLDVDVNQEIAIRYGIMGIPTLGMFSGGKAPIKDWIEKFVPVAEPERAAEQGAA